MSTAGRAGSPRSASVGAGARGALARALRRAACATVLCAAALAAKPQATVAADPPAPAPAPSLALSDKPAPGCCCIADRAAGKPPGCTYGLQEDKCRAAAKVVPTWSATWTPGKCPER